MVGIEGLIGGPGGFEIRELDREGDAGAVRGLFGRAADYLALETGLSKRERDYTLTPGGQQLVAEIKAQRRAKYPGQFEEC